MGLLEYLKLRIAGEGEFRDVALLVSNNLAYDVEPVFLQGLRKVGRVVLARSFTRHGWLLAIHHAIGMVEGETLIIYYNAEDPRWTASTLIHEVIHIALDIERNTALNVLVDEALAYTASFKSGFYDLYLEGVKRAMKVLSGCKNPYEDHEVLSIVTPRILALNLVNYDYRDLARLAIAGPKALLRLWLETAPPEEEVQALATALALSGINPGIPSLEPPCREVTAMNSHSYQLEGVDKDFLEMLRLLKRAARNRYKAREILKAWWSELREIRHELEAYLDIHTE